jgi:hypothetical protein
MYSVMAGAAVAVVVLCIALHKGRTGWHWFLFSLISFASLWVLAALGLFLANVHYSIASTDKRLAVFVGVITGLIIVTVLLAVPPRPKRHAIPRHTPSR